MSMAVLEKGGKPAATRKDGICLISWSSGFFSKFPEGDALCSESFGHAAEPYDPVLSSSGFMN